MSDDSRLAHSAGEATMRLITRLGYVCLAVWIAVLVGMGTAWPEPFSRSWRLVFGQMMAGRAFSVSEGINLGFPHIFLLFQVALQDIIILLLLYRLLIAGYRRVEKVRVIGPAIMRVRQSAEAHRSRVEPFGAIGIALFVLFPFWSTGPLVGSVLGYMLGIRTWLVFVSVIVGNLLSVGCWIFFFQSLADLMKHLNMKLPVSLPLMILLTVIVLGASYQVWSSRMSILRWLRAVARGPQGPAPGADENVPQ